MYGLKGFGFIWERWTDKHPVFEILRSGLDWISGQKLE